MKLVVSGIIVHIIFLASIFDVYFNSPVIQGISVHKPTFPPIAKRLVLFVADGLRARTFYNNRLNESPYLRSIIENRGSWGVSHTRVPTESRPGHVALIAGLYEDPSAVTKGWQENPVEFDSVFNRSRHTWAWGSEDILPMFAKGEASGRVTTYCYPKSMQKFSGDGSNEKLDTWVLDRVLAFFNNNDKEQMREENLIFFLHLLGIDTTGHATKPHSRQYMDNIRLVDYGVKKVEEAVERFYGNDGKTAYVFTSDHGMTDWGSHGAGLPDETETPLVVWGAGLDGPRNASSGSTTLESPRDWNLADLQRRDVQQADIAALMAALLAIPTPTNSVGLLPRHVLSGSDDWITQAFLSNAHQMVLQLDRARELVHNRLLQVFLRPFPGLPHLDLAEAERLAQQGQHKAAMQLIENIYKLSLEGIKYYQDYFATSLKWALTTAHFCWLAFLFKSLLVDDSYKKKNAPKIVHILMLFSVSVICCLVLVQELPPQYIVYYSLPLVLLWALCKDWEFWWPRLRSVLHENGLALFMSAALTVLALCLLVSSFFYRASLSVSLVMVALWPVVERLLGSPVQWQLCAAWAANSLVLAAFPMLPVIGREADYTLVLMSGITSSAVGLVASSLVLLCVGASRMSRVLLFVQASLPAASATLVFLTALSFQAGSGLLWTHQTLAWTLFACSWLLPSLAGREIAVRQISVWLSLATVLLLLSVRHEAFFLLTLVMALSLYPAIELQVAAQKPCFTKLICEEYDTTKISGNEHATYGDLRRAYFYLFFTVLAFFGLGNVASLNSFDPAWVRCLATTFAPHLMGGLILLKTVAPILAVATGICTTAFLTRRPVEWLLVLAVCDAMSLPFFHLVLTEGSWLDIGQSISHFVIAHACVLLLLLLHWVACRWLSAAWPSHPSPALPTHASKTHGE